MKQEEEEGEEEQEEEEEDRYSPERVKKEERVREANERGGEEC